VDKVTGSLKPEGIEALISKGIGLSTKNSHNETLIAAGKLISEGKPEEAAKLYSEVRILDERSCAINRARQASSLTAPLAEAALRPQVLAASRKAHGALAVAGLALCAMAGRDLPAALELVTLLRTDPDFKTHLEDPIVKQALTAVCAPSPHPSCWPRRPRLTIPTPVRVALDRTRRVADPHSSPSRAFSDSKPRWMPRGTRCMDAALYGCCLEAALHALHGCCAVRMLSGGRAARPVPVPASRAGPSRRAAGRCPLSPEQTHRPCAMYCPCRATRRHRGASPERDVWAG
jgi:hypothetical protein